MYWCTDWIAAVACPYVQGIMIIHLMYYSCLLECGSKIKFFRRYKLHWVKAKSLLPFFSIITISKKGIEKQKINASRMYRHVLTCNEKFLKVERSRYKEKESEGDIFKNMEYMLIAYMFLFSCHIWCVILPNLFEMLWDGAQWFRSIWILRYYYTCSCPLYSLPIFWS